jgi:uncharacterized protein (DUF1684 family)
MRSTARLAFPTVSLALLLAACGERGGGGGAVATTPAPPPAAADEAHTADVEAWRQTRRERLEAPEGWLSLVGLEWLDEGANTLGSAADADVRFPARLPAQLGVIERQGSTFRLVPAPGVELTAGEPPAPVSGPMDIASDATGEPTIVRHGAVAFFVIERGDRVALRIKDAESPVRTGFQGLDYYAIDPRWRVTARFEPAPAGTTMPVPNILGTVDESPSQGSVVFTHDGQEVRLRAIDEGDGRLFLVFGDKTNGKATYGGGRFLYADPPAAGSSTVVVDFNKSYNPPCVFTPYATCPLPPAENKLPFAVEAGEKLWSGYDAMAHHPTAGG